jgi:hypothetical protein
MRDTKCDSYKTGVIDDKGNIIVKKKERDKTKRLFQYA